MTAFYQEYRRQYEAAGSDMRTACKAHWTRCYHEAIAAGNESGVIHAARLLAVMAVTDDSENK